jgi:hypothetical protein
MSDPQPTASERRAQRLREWRLRAARLLLLVGAGAIVIYAFHGRPLAIEARIHFGSARHGLRAAQVVYLEKDRGELRRVRFDYSRTAAPASQLHQVEIPKGEYSVEIELTYGRGEVAAGLGGRRELGAGSEERVTLRRPLHVRGKGEVTIFVKDD